MQAAGLKVGYLKPVSMQPARAGGRILDEDADFVRRSLGLDTPPWELAPIVIDTELLQSVMNGTQERDLLAVIKNACEATSRSMMWCCWKAAPVCVKVTRWA